MSPYRRLVLTPCTDRYRAARAALERAQLGLERARGLDEPWLSEAAERAFDRCLLEVTAAKLALSLSDELWLAPESRPG